MVTSQDFAVPVVVGVVYTTGIFSRQIKAQGFGMQDATVLVNDPNVLVEADSLPPLHVGDSIRVDGKPWIVRDRQAESDGKLMRVFLQEVS